jgi:hypothetical protein
MNFPEANTFLQYFHSMAHLTIPDFEQLAKINLFLQRLVITSEDELRDELKKIGFFGPDVPSIIAKYAANSLGLVKNFFYAKMQNWKPDDESASFRLEPKDYYEVELLRNGLEGTSGFKKTL